MRHVCAQAGCDDDATNIVIESHPLAMLLRDGAALMCAACARDMTQSGGVDLGRVEDVAKAVLDARR